MRVLLAFGTRPEAVKMAPVYLALKHVPGLTPTILLTGQHKEQLADALRPFDLAPEANLEVMRPEQTLPELAGRILPAAAAAIRKMRPDYLLVHGDTLSTFAVAWAAFLEGVPVGHVEAGLRSHDLKEPFPEEANRRLVAAISDLDLAPTPGAKENLLNEGKPRERVLVTGQTAIDAVRYVAERAQPPPGLPEKNLVVVTLHRRENWPQLAGLASKLAEAARAFPELNFVYPVHKNPVVRRAVYPALRGLENFYLLEPLPYDQMAALVARARLIVTDSGGLQEEAAAFGVGVVVARNVTERPEGVEAGGLRLAGNDPEGFGRALFAALNNPEALRWRYNPFGDGRAGKRVAGAVAWRLGLGPRPAEFSPRPG